MILTIIMCLDLTHIKCSIMVAAGGVTNLGHDKALG